MDFYNEKLLPKGLPEIIVQFVPHEIYPFTKVITYPRKAERGLHGRAGWEGITSSYYVKLYPTTICLNPEGIGTYSFRLWYTLLRVALHEVGHLVDRERYDTVSEEEYQNYKIHGVIENAADSFAYAAMKRIGEVDPRLGQPSGALTGYAGVLAYRRRSGSFTNATDRGRIEEWRALKCDAQMGLGGVVSQLQGLVPDRDYLSPLLVRPLVRSIVRREAVRCGLNRYFENRNGRRYLMFNYEEAIRTVEACRDAVSKLQVHSSWRTLYRRCGAQVETGESDEWRWTIQRAVQSGEQPCMTGFDMPKLNHDEIPF